MTVLLWTACAEPPGRVADRLLAAAPDARLVERVPGGRPVVVVVEIPARDPRAAGQPGAADVVRRLLDAGATGAWLASGDGAYALAGTLGARAHVVPGGDDDAVASLRRTRALLADPLTPFARSRDLVVAGIAGPDDVRAWAALRVDASARYDLAASAYQALGASLADAALADAGPAVVGVPGPSAAAAVERLHGRGGTVVRLRPADLDGLPDLDLWWADLRAGLPPAVPPEDGLPSLAGWVEAVRPHAEALARWDGREEVRRAVRAEVGPVPPELGPADPRRAAVLAAAERIPTGPVLDPEALLATVRLCERPKAGTAMSYDALFDVVKVGDWATEADPALVAAVLAHELVHVHDVHAAATALGTDPSGWALLLDTLPLGISASLTLAAEDRAFRVEAVLLRDVDGLPSPAEADRIRGDPGAAPTDALRATLASIRATPPGTVAWLQLVSDLTPVPAR